MFNARIDFPKHPLLYTDLFFPLSLNTQPTSTRPLRHGKRSVLQPVSVQPVRLPEMDIQCSFVSVEAYLGVST